MGMSEEELDRLEVTLTDQLAELHAQLALTARQAQSIAGQIAGIRAKRRPDRDPEPGDFRPRPSREPCDPGLEATNDSSSL